MEKFFIKPTYYRIQSNLFDIRGFLVIIKNLDYLEGTDSSRPRQ
jgi:hypothetical protein